MHAFARVVIAVGIMVAGLSGLCSLYLLSTVGTYGDGALTDALFGLIPITVGIAMILMGRAALRREEEGGED